MHCFFSSLVFLPPTLFKARVYSLVHEVSGFNECMTDSVTCGQESKYDRIRCRLQKSQGVEPDFGKRFLASPCHTSVMAAYLLLLRSPIPWPSLGKSKCQRAAGSQQVVRLAQRSLDANTSYVILILPRSLNDSSHQRN